MKKQNHLLIFVGVVTLVLFTVLIASTGIKKSQDLRSRAADPASGELILDPASFAADINTPFPVTVKTNVGPTNGVSVARFSLLYDPAILEIASCTSGADFEGILGQTPCTVDNVSGQVTVSLQARSIDGPTDVVPLVELSVNGIADGVSNIQVDSGYQIVVKDLSNPAPTPAESRAFTIALVQDGTFAIGTAQTTPIATLTPRVGGPGESPTPGSGTPTVPDGSPSPSEVPTVEPPVEVSVTDTAIPTIELPTGIQGKIRNIFRRLERLINKIQSIITRIDSLWSRIQRYTNRMSASGADLSSISVDTKKLESSRQEVETAMTNVRATLEQMGSEGINRENGKVLIKQLRSLKSGLRAYYSSLKTVTKKLKKLASKDGARYDAQTGTGSGTQQGDDDDSGSSGTATGSGNQQGSDDDDSQTPGTATGSGNQQGSDDETGSTGDVDGTQSQYKGYSPGVQYRWLDPEPVYE